MRTDVGRGITAGVHIRPRFIYATVPGLSGAGPSKRDRYTFHLNFHERTLMSLRASRGIVVRAIEIAC